MLYDLGEARRQLARAAYEPVTESELSVRNVPAPPRERKQWIYKPPLTERFTAEELKQIVKDTKSMTQAAVAEKYGVSVLSVGRLVKKMLMFHVVN